MTRYVLPILIEPLGEGQGYLALCPALQGCHAEGRTMAEAIDNLQDVARILLELRVEDGLPIPEELQVASSDERVVLHGEVLVAVGER